jgi:hypothetical protein
MESPSKSQRIRNRLIVLAVTGVIAGVATAIITPRVVNAMRDDSESDSQCSNDTQGRCGREEQGRGGAVLSTGLGMLRRAVGGSSGDKNRQNEAEDPHAFQAYLTALRNGIEMHATEHMGNWPDAERIEGQLTQHTDEDGNVSPTRDDDHRYGPYLRKVPPVTVGPNNGISKIGDSRSVSQGDPGYGWIYDAVTGEIRGNTGSARDAQGRLYSDY